MSELQFCKMFLNSKTGLNLAELVISILILATVIIVLMTIFIGGMTGLNKSERQIVMASALQSALEQYCQDVLYDFDNPVYNNGTCYRISGPYIVDKMEFREKWVAFEEIGSEVRNRLKRITVTIYYYDKGLEGGAISRKKSSSIWINNFLTY